MNGRNGRFRAWLALAAVLVLVSLSAGRAEAQFGGMGYGAGFTTPSFGPYGVGNAGMVYGFGYPGMGYGALGAGYAYGYPGLGYAGIGYRYAYPGLLNAGVGYGYVYPGLGYGGVGYMPSLNFSGAPYVNPTFGTGLTPLGMNSALTERYVLGRGAAPSYYVRSYAPGTRRAPASAPRAR